MRERIQNLRPFDGVASNGKPTVNIQAPAPMRAHLIEVEYQSDNAGTVQRRNKATMLAEIDYVELYINNKLQRKLEIAKLFEDWELRGNTVEDGIIPIAFSRDERTLSVERDATAAFLGVGDTFRVDVKLKASTDPRLTAWIIIEPFDDANDYAELRDILQKRRGMRQLIETVRTDTVNVAATGKLTFSLSGQGRDISFIKFRTTNCTYMTVYRGTEKKWEGRPADFDRMLDQKVYVPQAGVIHWSPEAFGGGRVPDWYQFRGKLLRFELEMSAAVPFDAEIYEVGDAVR